MGEQGTPNGVSLGREFESRLGYGEHGEFMVGLVNQRTRRPVKAKQRGQHPHPTPVLSALAQWKSSRLVSGRSPVQSVACGTSWVGVSTMAVRLTLTQQTAVRFRHALPYRRLPQARRHAFEACGVGSYPTAASTPILLTVGIRSLKAATRGQHSHG